MKKLTKIKIAFFFLLFVGALVFFGFNSNRIEEKTISVLPESSLPTITLSYYGHDMNELSGYVTEMDTGYMREDILPIEDDRTVSFTIDSARSKISDLNFEIRPLDNSRQIQGDDITDIKQKGDKLSASFKVLNLVEQGQEYLLVFHLKADDRDVNYYTRIMYSPKSAVDECINFAMDFHNYTMDKEKALELKTFMEPDRNKDNSSLHDVTIKSSLKQLAWGDLDFVQDGDIYMEVSEIGTAACEITFFYDVVRQGEESREKIEVKEFYRVRKGEDRVYLLDFERTLDEEFSMSGFQGKDNIIKLGIVSPEVNYKYNDIGTICAFEQDGDLYIYSEDDNTITKVFSFKGKNNRDSYRNYGIKILTIDGTGMMDFLVYGYMGAGEREGQVGVSLYHYDETSEEIEERVFIASNRNATVLEADMKDLFYENAHNEVFILIDGVLEKININTGETSQLLTGLVPKNYSVSDSGRFIAYIEDGDSKTVHILDLKDGDLKDISAPSGASIIPLLFMQEDFVYGIATKEDIANYDGEGVPMYSVRIVDAQKGEDGILKDYRKAGFYVTNVNLDGYTLYLDRIQMFEGGGIQEAKQDTIMNSQGEDMNKVKVAVTMDEVKQSVVSLVLQDREDLSDEERPNIRRTVSSQVDSKPTLVTLPEEDFLDCYYTYRGPSAVLATSDPTEAIMLAHEVMGQVVDGKANTIWKRGRLAYKNNIGVKVGSSDAESGNVAKCLSAILDLEGENIQVESLLATGRSPASILQSTLKEMIVLDLTGVNPEQVMYYISKGTPVYTMLGENNPVLLVGYDNFNFSYFDPSSETIKKVGQEDAKELCDLGLNVFVAYLR
ncbi:MAG: hypothetical protein MJ110_04830 [Lachnospiraceae bacterium]|nr:hypothetical protein [Lachnospiraceae bacterium]